MKTYQIYNNGLAVGIAFGEREAEAIFNFMEDHPGYIRVTLTAFEIDIP